LPRAHAEQHRAEHQLFLAVVPILLGAYVWRSRRARRVAVRFSSVALVRAALPRRSRFRRHVAVALFLVALAGLATAAARPHLAAHVPLGRTSIILAVDVSPSMCATDVSPNRLSVAQDAARTFVQDQVAGTRIGVVAFAGFAELIVPPTPDKARLLDAINGLTISSGTAIGAATLLAVDAIAAVNPDVAPAGASSTGQEQEAGTTAAPARGYVPDIIVLLTDGANTRGIRPLDAADEAADRRVRVYTIGFGTTRATTMVCTRDQLGAYASGDGSVFPPGGGPSSAQYLLLDEPVLCTMADVAGGAFYR
jgi:Ca-activated chloride channel family protein